MVDKVDTVDKTTYTYIGHPEARSVVPPALSTLPMTRPPAILYDGVGAKQANDTQRGEAHA